MRSKAQPKADTSRGVKFKDMYAVVQEVLVPMQPPGAITSFRLDEREIFDNLLLQIRRDCPTLAGRVEGL